MKYKLPHEHRRDELKHRLTVAAVDLLFVATVVLGGAYMIVAFERGF
jgi:hypothetical protein